MSYGRRECRELLAKKGVSRLSRWISCVAVGLDSTVRRLDFQAHRSWGGKLGRWKLLTREGQVCGHAPLALFLPSLLAVFVVLGPKPLVRSAWVWWQAALGLVLLAAAWGGLILVFRHFRERALFWAQFWWIASLSALVGIVVWLLEENNLAIGTSPTGEALALEATDTLYHHLILKLLFVLLVALAIAKWLSGRLIGKLQKLHHEKPDGSVISYLRQGLRETELFQRQRYPIVTWSGLAMSVVSAFLYRLVLLLYLPALALVIAIPAAATKWIWVLLILLPWFFVVVLVELHPRLDAMSMILKRSFFTGGQLVVSILVIVLGLGRYLEIQYISSVIESGSGPVLALFVLAAYAFFWFYEYWINRLMGEEIIELLRSDDDPIRHAGQVSYAFEPPSCDEDEKTNVPHDRRVLQVHGGARMVVLRPPGRRWPLFQLLERMDLLRRICRGAPPDVFADVRKRLRFYFSVLNLLLLVMIFLAGRFIFAGPQLAQHPQVPERKAETIAEAQAADLRALVFDESAGDDVVLLAASGGGTRAAMYTTAALLGLAENGVLAKLKLASGVSGGGAALAYYAGHLDQLRPKPSGLPDGRNNSEDTMEAWKKFQDTMDDPFIADVIEGAGEGRIFGQTRLGQLLAESFARRFDDGGKTFGDIGPDFGLILNTAVAGVLRVDDCSDGEPFRDCAYKRHRLTRGSKKGARLIFTNLAREEAFPGLQETVPAFDPLGPDVGINFSYEVVRDRATELTTAAALNANFPPVFSNAAVDLREKNLRYWVTDGGAVENRGVLSLLFALRDAVVQQRASGERKPLPRIHVLLAEASAAGSGYSRFPGLSSAFGAPSKLGSQLMKDLARNIEEEMSRICECDAGDFFRIYYLGMPGPLRVDGGLGTHWMLHDHLRLGDPHQCDPEKRQGKTIKGVAARDVIYQLFTKQAAEATLDCQRAREEGRPETDECSAWLAIKAAEDAAGCWREDWNIGWKAFVENLDEPLRPTP